MNCEPKQTRMLQGPPCEKCGGATRILAIAPHKRLKRRNVWTLACVTCGAEQTAAMPRPYRPH